MATYTCGPGGTYSSIQTCIAAAVLVDGDTMQLTAGYDVDERILPSGLSNITVVGDSNDKENYNVYYSNPAGTSGLKCISMNGCDGWTFRGFKGAYTGAYSTSSGFAHGGYGTNGDHLFEDLTVETSGYYGIAGMGSNTTYRRLKIDGSSHSAANNAYLLGPDSPGSSGTVVESCIVINSSYLCIYLGTNGNAGPTIKNTTVYNDRTVGNASAMGMYILGDNAKVYNSVVAMDSTFTNDRALFFGTPSSATVKDCVLYGAYWGDNSDLNSTTGTVSNVTKSSGVSSSAVVFIDASNGDFKPVESGLIYKTGNSSFVPGGGDLNSLAWSALPSIGALSVYVAPVTEHGEEIHRSIRYTPDRDRFSVTFPSGGSATEIVLASGALDSDAFEIAARLKTRLLTVDSGFDAGVSGGKIYIRHASAFDLSFEARPSLALFLGASDTYSSITSVAFNGECIYSPDLAWLSTLGLTRYNKELRTDKGLAQSLFIAKSTTWQIEAPVKKEEFEQLRSLLSFLHSGNRIRWYRNKSVGTAFGFDNWQGYVDCVLSPEHLTYSEEMQTAPHQTFMKIGFKLAVVP